MRTTLVAEIEETLDAYVRGTREGDAALLGSLFHPRAVVAGYLGDDLAVRSPDAFIDHAATTRAGGEYRAAVTEITLAGATATATLVEDGLWEGASFVNRFHLIRNPGGAWVITARLFHQDAPGARAPDDRHQGS